MPRIRILLATAAVALAHATAMAAEPKAFAMTLENGALHEGSDTVRVKQGDSVELRWTSDRPTTLHLHGYDIESKVAPGKATLMAFKATLPGRFPVEVHAAGKGPHRAVLYLEVYP